VQAKRDAKNENEWDDAYITLQAQTMSPSTNFKSPLSLWIS
jgi:hypothetical protein